MRPTRAGKLRRALLFVFAVVALCGLNVFGLMLSRPMPLWFNLGWLGVFAWMCWAGWDDDENGPPSRWMTLPGVRRLGYATLLVIGVGLCWLGWVGWQARSEGSLVGLAVIYGPVGVLCLLWLLGKLFVTLMRGR